MHRGLAHSLPRAILFDMDGTLTRPLLDFDAIRRDLRVEGPILEAMRLLHGDRLREAHAILDRHEREAAERSELNDGCVELLEWLESRRVRTSLITRNSRSSTAIILARHHLRFDQIQTREDEPAKPHPEPIFRAMKSFECERHEVWMVGDGSHDIESAQAAGVLSVWISHRSSRTFTTIPSVTIDALDELLPRLMAIENSPEGIRRV